MTAPVRRSGSRHVVLSLIALALGSVAACGGAEPEVRTARSADAAPSLAATEQVEPPAVLAGEPVAGAETASLAKTASAPKDDRPRIGALGPHTWIYKKPAFHRPALGKMRPGTAVALKSTTPVPGEGCPRGWYAVEPRGFVCLDASATLDLEDSYYRALAFSAPDPGTWPYRYAYSRDTPMYSRIPTPAEWAVVEAKYRKVGEHEDLGQWAHTYEELNLDEPIAATDPVPYFLEGGKRSAGGGNYSPQALVWRRAPNGVILSYSRAFEAHGRVWLLTPDSMVVPAERLHAMRRSTFHGVKLDEVGLALPLGWNRSGKPLALFSREGSSFVASSETVPPKSWVAIVDAPEKRDDMAYYPLRDRPGVFLGKTTRPEKQLDQPVSIQRAASKLPNGVAADERWIEIKIRPGTLTAYEGMRPVFATLFSPGKGGPPVPGLDHEKYMTTGTGWYPIEWKERVATMSSEEGEPRISWYTDVPNQQYLRAPLAMHTALWHEDFGKRKSKECVNVSPLDGDFLFGWTAPALPEGWNGIRPGDGNGKSTPVVSTAD
jgi:hypothetical protein